MKYQWHEKTMNKHRFKDQIIYMLVKAKVKQFKNNLAATIREYGKSYNLKIGHVEIGNPDIDNLSGLFTLWVPGFDIPVSVIIDGEKYSVSDLYNILNCIQTYFDLFDIVSGDIDTDLIDIFIADNILTLNCKSIKGYEYEYWTHKPYVKGLPYIISHFAIDIHLFEHESNEIWSMYHG